MKKIINLLVILLVIILTNNNTKTYKINKNNYRGQRVQNAVEYLIEKSNMETIESYKNGVRREMYTINHSAKDNINEYVDYRYIGNDPNNYVYFNCSDSSNLETCELWRIIGIFVTENEDGIKEYRLKIIRNDSIGSFIWNNNNWVDSDLYNNLNNGDFWFSLKGKYQDMIDTVKFSDGIINNISKAGSDLYFDEKKDTVLGKVGLPLLSDYSYTYSLEVDNNCYNNINDCKNTNLSWMNFKSSFWTITKDKIMYNNSENIEVFPVVYLKPSIGIESGNGSEGDAYVFRVLKKLNIQSEQEMLSNNDNIDIKKEVYVDDTSNNLSKFLFIIFGTLIIIGIIIIIINYIKSRKEIK